jgi:hypothetical protein
MDPAAEHTREAGRGAVYQSSVLEQCCVSQGLGLRVVGLLERIVATKRGEPVHVVSEALSKQRPTKRAVGGVVGTVALANSLKGVEAVPEVDEGVEERAPDPFGEVVDRLDQQIIKALCGHQLVFKGLG